GGALMDLGCYGLHALRGLAPWAGGAPLPVSARAGERAGAPGVDEWLDADLESPGGATGTVRCHMAYGGLQMRLRVGGTRGVAPFPVWARAGERAGAPGVDEWLDADLEYPGGATGTVRCHMAYGGLEMSLRVVGTRGEARAANFVLPHLDDQVVVRTGTDSRTEHLGTRSSYAYQLEAFAGAVRRGDRLPLDADDALATMTLVDACYRAAGLPVRPRTAPGH